MVNKLGSQGRIDVTPWREEIEERTRNGESCEQIAEALRSIHGIAISDKTISRKRVQWGLRQRAQRRSNPQTEERRAARRAVNLANPRHSSYRTKKQIETKADIVARTQRGETAERIASDLIAQGMKLNKGASTILRLQTYWGLIPFGQKRANEKPAKLTPERSKVWQERRAAKKAANEAKGAAAKALRQAGKAPVKPRGPYRKKGPTGLDPNIHYPSNCQAGPGQLRPLAPAPSSHGPIDPRIQGGGEYNPIEIQPEADSSDGDDYNPLPDINDDYMTNFDMVDASPEQIYQDASQQGQQLQQPQQYQQHQQLQQSQQTLQLQQHREPQPHVQRRPLPQLQPRPPPPAQLPPVDYVSEIMSAELMVDLAKSMLDAAMNVKDALVAAQQQRPVGDSATPPSADEVRLARRKLKDATKCVWELAEDGILHDV